MPYGDLKHGDRICACIRVCGTPTLNFGGPYFERSRGVFEAYAKIGRFLVPDHRGSRYLPGALNLQYSGPNVVVRRLDALESDLCMFKGVPNAHTKFGTCVSQVIRCTF